MKGLVFTARELSHQKETPILLDEKNGAIQQTKLYLEMERSLTRALTASTQLKEVALHLLRILGEAMNMAAGILWIVEDTQSVLRTLTSWRAQETSILQEFTHISKTFSFKLGEGFPGRIWKEKAVCWIEDVGTDAHFIRIQSALKANLHSAVGFPFFFEGKVVGIVEFFMHHLQKPNKNLILSLNHISDQLGIFVERERAQQKVSEILVSVKHLGEEYEKSKAEAQSVNKLKSQFLANMSHELRTPLNAVIGYSQMIQEDSESIEQKNYCEKVIYSAKHLLDLINDVLDLSKIEAGEMDIFLENIKIEELANGLKTFARHLVEENNNTFQLIIAPAIDSMCTDIIRVRQSLLNLISNAGKFTRNGRVTLEIKPLLQDNKAWVQFSVIDTGIGIPAEKLGNLFQAFSQVDASTTRKYGGTGLGLCLTKRLCEILGGWVTVESQENIGSVFSIVLPLKSEASAQHAIFSKNFLSFDASSVGERKTILIIDDDRRLHQEIQTQFEKNEWKLLHAFDGEEGLRLAEKYHPAVIILDVIMPIMDGWATLSALKTDAALSAIPVILMSVTAEEELGFTLGAVDYLHKPVHTEVLVNKIKQLTYIC